jgi:hypothetical protein
VIERFSDCGQAVESGRKAGSLVIHHGQGSARSLLAVLHHAGDHLGDALSLRLAKHVGRVICGGQLVKWSLIAYGH